MKLTLVSTRRAPQGVRRLGGGGLGHAPALTVRRQNRPYWMNAWTRSGHEYRGSYQTPYGAFVGWIYERTPREASFYIYQPPDELRRHAHWSCFQPHSTPGWFRIHMAERPGDVSSGIITIERVLMDAFES